MEDRALYTLFPEAQLFTNTKYKLFKSAIELFAQQGFSKTSTRQIAQRARVSEASLFKYFTNKRGVLTAILKPMAQHIFPDVIREFSQTILQAHTVNLRELITLIVHNRIDFFQKNPELTKIYLNELSTSPTLRQKLLQSFPKEAMQDFNTEINYLKQQQTIVPWKNSEIFRFIITTMLGYFVEHYVLFPQKKWSQTTEANHLITFITDGLTVNNH